MLARHILVPTDGTAQSETATDVAVRLAKALGARVTFLHVCPLFHTYGYLMEMLEEDRATFFQRTEEQAQSYLSVAAQAAKRAGLDCDVVSERDEHPHRAIIKSANARGCDLICMASHGRRGLEGFLLGSETQKVLTHSTIPVLVIPAARA